MTGKRSYQKWLWEVCFREHCSFQHKPQNRCKNKVDWALAPLLLICLLVTYMCLPSSYLKSNENRRGTQKIMDVFFFPSRFLHMKHFPPAVHLNHCKWPHLIFQNFRLPHTPLHMPEQFWMYIHSWRSKNIWYSPYDSNYLLRHIPKRFIPHIPNNVYVQEYSFIIFLYDTNSPTLFRFSGKLQAMIESIWLDKLEFKQKMLSFTRLLDFSKLNLTN